MNCHIRSLLFVSALTLMLVCGFAYFAPGDRLTAVAAQSTPPTGSFGYVINFGVTRGSTDSGAAFLGVFNFDGAGNLTGSYTAQLGPTERRPAVTGTGTLTGTYSSNPDGTGTLTAALDAGLTFTFATVFADGGQSLQLAATGCSGGCNIAGDVISGIARSAYTGPLKGSFGFHLDSSPEPGTVIGVVNFDGSGNAAVSFTAVAAGHDPSQAPVLSGTLAGTYSTNPDGSGMLTLSDASGQPAGTYAFVMTDAGSGALLLQTGTTGNNVQFGTARLQ